MSIFNSHVFSNIQGFHCILPLPFFHRRPEAYFLSALFSKDWINGAAISNHSILR